MTKLGLPDVIVTARGSKNGSYDFVSRVFVPGLGIPEDPVTGAAHCALAHYWSRKTGKTVFRAYQASQRGGEMTVVINDQNVVLRGKAITIFDTTMRA